MISRLKSAWLLDQEGLRAIPYIENLKKEATFLYLIPGIIVSCTYVLINIFLGNANITDIASLLYIFFSSYLLELGFIIIYIGVIFLTMMLVLPGFPNESHASPLMVYQVFAYIFTIRILFAFSIIMAPITEFYVLVFLFYLFYFVVELSFAFRTLVGKRMLISVIIAFIDFYGIFIIFRVYQSVLILMGI